MTVEVWTSPCDLGDVEGDVEGDWRSRVRCVGVSTQMALTTSMAFNQSRDNQSKGGASEGEESQGEGEGEGERKARL